MSILPKTISTPKPKKDTIKKSIKSNQLGQILIKPKVVQKSKILPNSAFLFVSKRSYLDYPIEKNNKIQAITIRYWNLFNCKDTNKKIYNFLTILNYIKLTWIEVVEFDCFYLIKEKQSLKMFEKLKKEQIASKKYSLKMNTKLVNKIDFISILSFSFNSNMDFFRKFTNSYKKAITLFFFNYNKPKQNKAYFTLANFYTYKFLLSFLYSRKLNLLTPKLLKFFLLKFHNKNLNTLKFLLWKNNTLSNIKKSKRKNISSSFLFFLQRLEEKIDFAENNLDTTQITELQFLRDWLYTYLEKNNTSVKSKSTLIMHPDIIKDFRIVYLKAHLFSFFNKQKQTSILTSSKNTISIAPQIKKIKKIFKKKSSEVVVVKNYRIRRWRKPLEYNKKFLGKRITFSDENFNYKQNVELISLLFGYKMNVYFINALSLTRFEYHLQLTKKKKKGLLHQKKSSVTFINKLERDFVKRYKFVANYLQDFARVGFIALYTKDLSFLVKFVAFQIAHLQKNRKETKLVRFISKAIKVFSAQREEVIALKVQFKGRVNRWRRTKIITARRGIIPYNTYATRLEYATATSVTRKGALGIRLWVYFNQTFNSRINRGLTAYIKANKVLKHKQIFTQFFK